MQNQHLSVLILACILLVVVDSSKSSHQQQCTVEDSRREPPISTKLPKNLSGRMEVVLADVPNPFWFAVPPPEDLPGYYIDSFRASKIMCPSLSSLFHHLLHSRCSQTCSESPQSRPLVVDVGAHLGWFSFLAASYGCRVIAVEPQPHIAFFFNATIALNGWQDRITLVSAAIGEEEGQVRVVNDAPNDWAVATTVPMAESNKGDVVRAVRIDSLVKEDVALLKIDTEGLEYNSIRSASGLFRNYKVDSLVVETKPEDDKGKKRKWLQSMLEDGWFAYTFYEEIFRTVDVWKLPDYVFPLFQITSFKDWPASQLYQDHIFVRTPLPVPEKPEVKFLFPPADFKFHPKMRISSSIVVRAMAPSKGKIRLFLDDQNVGDYGFGQDGGGDRPEYGRLDIALPELGEGSHSLGAVLVDSEGEEVGEEASVTFHVDQNGHFASRRRGTIPHWYYHVYGAGNTIEE